jgi:hypothetical protein
VFESLYLRFFKSTSKFGFLLFLRILHSFNLFAFEFVFDNKFPLSKLLYTSFVLFSSSLYKFNSNNMNNEENTNKLIALKDWLNLYKEDENKPKQVYNSFDKGNLLSNTNYKNSNVNKLNECSILKNKRNPNLEVDL